MSSVDVFERVRTGQITAGQGADLLAASRAKQARPSKPAWMPRPIYVVGMLLLALFLPRLVGRNSS